MNMALMLQMTNLRAFALLNDSKRMNSTAQLASKASTDIKMTEMTYCAPRLRLFEPDHVDRSMADSGQDLYINFVGPEATETEIFDIFSEFGYVQNVNLKPAKDNFSSKCWVTMDS